MKRIKGAFSLEATIVMSSVLIIMFAIFFAFMLVYQHAMITYAASTAATQGAKSWIELGGDGRYWRLTEFGTITSGTKIEKVKKIAMESMTTKVVNSKSNHVNVTYKNVGGTGKIIVEIAQDLIVPFQGVAKFFNGGKPLQLRATATASVAEPTEIIRNIDYGVEWVMSISEWLGKKLGKALEGNQAVETISALFGL